MTVSGLRAGRAIEGVEQRRLNSHRDERGAFTEVFRETCNVYEPMTQWSVVSSGPRVLRGVYLHRRHDEYICVLQGHVSVGLRDLRPHSPTAGAWMLIDLHGVDMMAVSFPRGIAHGWYCHEKSVHLQAVTEDYGAYNHDDNLGCHWADPDLEIPWPDRSPIVSARSAALGSLAELEALLADESELAYPSLAQSA